MNLVKQTVVGERTQAAHLLLSQTQWFCCHMYQYEHDRLCFLLASGVRTFTSQKSCNYFLF